MQLTQWQSHHDEHPPVGALAVPAAAAALAEAEAAEPDAVVDPARAFWCSETPLSLPQFAVYHWVTRASSWAAVQDVLQTVPGELFDWVYTLEQKHCQFEPHCVATEVRMVHCCAHVGRLPMPLVRSWAEAEAATRRRPEVMLMGFIVSDVA